MPSSSSLSNEFLNLHSYGFYATTPFTTSSLTTDVFDELLWSIDELLWSIDGDEIYLHCIKLNESTFTFSVDKPLVDSI
jgi:hypothetical protein